MKLKLFLVPILLITIVSACKKDTVFTGPKIDQLTDFKARTITTYTYNSDGTVSITQQDIGAKSTWQYNNSVSPKTVLQDNYSGQGSISSATIYFLNSSGYADSAQGQYQLSNSSTSFTYDGNNQVTEQRNYISGSLRTIYDYTMVNKNITELNTTTVGPNTHTYDYYVYSASNTNTIGVQDKGLYYLGISSTNLVQTDIQINNALDTTDIITYRYLFNTNSQVDTMSSYHRNGQQIDSMAFTYY